MRIVEVEVSGLDSFTTALANPPCNQLRSFDCKRFTSVKDLEAVDDAFGDCGVYSCYSAGAISFKISAFALVSKDLSSAFNLLVSFVV